MDLGGIIGGLGFGLNYLGGRKSAHEARKAHEEAQTARDKQTLLLHNYQMRQQMAQLQAAMQAYQAQQAIAQAASQQQEALDGAYQRDFANHLQGLATPAVVGDVNKRAGQVAGKFDQDLSAIQPDLAGLQGNTSTAYDDYANRRESDVDAKAHDLAGRMAYLIAASRSPGDQRATAGKIGPELSHYGRDSQALRRENQLRLTAAGMQQPAFVPVPSGLTDDTILKYNSGAGKGLSSLGDALIQTASSPKTMDSLGSFFSGLIGTHNGLPTGRAIESGLPMGDGHAYAGYS